MTQGGACDQCSTPLSPLGVSFGLYKCTPASAAPELRVTGVILSLGMGETGHQPSSVMCY